MKNRESKGCGIIRVAFYEFSDFHIAAMPSFRILVPSSPESGCAIGTAYVQVPSFLSENQVNAGNVAERYFPVAVRFFIFKEVVKLLVGEAELQEIPERLKFPARR